jgi:hypothetical protein
MDEKTKQSSAQQGAQKYFRKEAAQDDSHAKNVRKERAANASKTAKLRALRLEKETADKESADKLSRESPGATSASPRKRSSAVATTRMVRMRY